MTDELARGLADLEHLVDAGRYEDAVARGGGLAAAHPEESGPLRWVAVAHLSLGRPVPARDAAREALRRAPGDVAAHRVLALVHDRLGDRLGARDHAERAVAMQPGSAESWRTLAIVRDGEPEGVAAARRALELAPGAAEMHDALGIALLPTDREAARAAFEEALRLDPANARIRSNLALAELRGRSLRGRSIGRAAEGFVDAVRLDPRLTLALRNLQVVYLVWLRLAHVAVLGAALVTSFALVDASPARRLVVRTAWFVLVGVGVALAGRTLARMSPALRRDFLRSLRSRPRLWIWTLALAAVVVVTSVTVFAVGPAGDEARSVMFRLVLWMNIAFWITDRRRRKKEEAT